METINIKEFSSIAEKFLTIVKTELDQYTSQKGDVEQTETGARMYTPGYVQFARYGRGPGKQPPVDIILDYVNQKKISFEGLTPEGTAWAIAKKIAHAGTSNYVPGAGNIIQETLDKYMPDFMGQVSNIASVEIMKQIKVDRLPIYFRRYRF